MTYEDCYIENLERRIIVMDTTFIEYSELIARLRELVKSMYTDLSYQTFPPDWLDEYKDIMHELGIEV